MRDPSDPPVSLFLSYRRYGFRGLCRFLLLAQLMARQLSDRRARQIVDEFDLRRHFVLAELAGELRAQLVERERLCAGSELDEGFCGLAAIRVGNAEHDHLVHAW